KTLIPFSGLPTFLSLPLAAAQPPQIRRRRVRHRVQQILHPPAAFHPLPKDRVPALSLGTSVSIGVLTQASPMAAGPTAWTSPEATTTPATMSSSDSPWPSPPPCSPGASLSSVTSCLPPSFAIPSSPSAGPPTTFSSGGSNSRSRILGETGRYGHSEDSLETERWM
ncbi:hypothetical protein LINPERHAP1_LOCUS26392, partial [Linum perenne]